MKQETAAMNLYLSLPEEIGNLTLNDLLNHPDTDVSKHGNKLALRRDTTNEIITLTIATRTAGSRETSLSTDGNRPLKKNYKDDILEMKKQGMSQKDIAMEFGISESYVSAIIRRRKTKEE